jgi:hypothetical protein
MQAAGIVRGNPSRMSRIALLAVMIVAALLALGYIGLTSRPTASARPAATMHAVEPVPSASTQPFGANDVPMPGGEWPGTP